MGIACQIIKDRQGNILEVEAPNGSPSILYRNLEQIVGDPTSALDMWALSYTDEFLATQIDSTRDNNGEHLWTTVLKFIEQDNREGKNLDDTTLSDLYDFVKDMEESISFSSTLAMLNDAYFTKGVFSPNSEKLSALYHPSEVKNILSSAKLQQRIKSTLDKLNAQETYKKDNERLNPLTSSTFESNLFVLGDRISSLGKAERIDVSNIPQLADIEFREDFTQAIKDLGNEALSDRYNSDEQFSNDLFNFYSKRQAVEVVNPDLSPVLENDIKSTILASFIPKNMNRVDGIIGILNTVSNEVWNQTPDQLEDAMNTLSTLVMETGIDMSRLPDSLETKSREEILDFLNTLNTFLISASMDSLNEEQLDLFSNAYNTFFNISPTPLMEVSNKTEDTILRIYTNLTEEEIFLQHSMIKVGENTYQKIEKEQNPLEVVYDMVIDEEMEDTVLPQSAFYPGAYTSGKFSINKLRNPNNKEAVMLSMDNFLNKLSENAVEKEINLYKLIFNHPIATKQRAKDDVLFDLFEKGTSSLSYLTGEFLHDLQVEKLKQMGTPLYNQVLKHINITQEGVFVDDALAPSVFRAFTENKDGVYNYLRQYAAISKQPNLNSLVSPTILSEKTIPYLRNFYVNNPQHLMNYKNTVTRDGDNISIPNTDLNFIRINDVVYERMGGNDGVSVYTPISQGVDNSFNMLGIPNRYNTTYPMSLQNSALTSSPSKTKIKRMMKAEQRDEIEGTLDRCS